LQFRASEIPTQKFANENAHLFAKLSECVSHPKGRNGGPAIAFFVCLACEMQLQNYNVKTVSGSADYKPAQIPKTETESPTHRNCQSGWIWVLCGGNYGGIGGKSRYGTPAQSQLKHNHTRYKEQWYKNLQNMVIKLEVIYKQN